MIVQLLLNDLGVYYLVGLLIMLPLVGQVAQNPFVNRLMGDPSPVELALATVALAFIWPVVLAEAINGNDRGRH